MIYKRRIKYDYKYKLQWGDSRAKRPRRHSAARRSIAVVCLLTLLATSAWYLLPPIVIESSPAEKPDVIAVPLALGNTQSSPASWAASATLSPAQPGGDGKAGATEEARLSEKWLSVTVKPGDNLSLIFSRRGFSKRDLHSILELGAETKELKRLKPGQQIRFLLDDSSDFVQMLHERTLEQTLHVTRHDSGEFSAEVVVAEPDRLIANAHGTIESSLFLAGQASGLSDAVIMELSEIFGWDIDFVLDIRNGDSFALIYEELYKEGKKVRDGAILAAEFVNRNKRFRAVRYIDRDGRADYYSPSALNMRKAFLRTPVKFSRISSRFNLRRKHPVLNTIRAHRGVDYASPHGTPVKATGDGKIVSMGLNGGYGKSVVLQHGGVYSTLYAHLSRYARGTKKGKSVRQGQTIGYVGQTGLATGPHLHYEFRLNGVHRNPLTIELPTATPIAKKLMPDFQKQTSQLLAQLDQLAPSAFAQIPPAEDQSTRANQAIAEAVSVLPANTGKN